MSATLLRQFVMAVCLLGIATIAAARDRNVDGGWKLGHGHDHYGIYRWEGRGWRRMPGSATVVGDGWVIGTDRRSGGFGIYRWSGRGWQRVPGGAVDIGGSYARPWVVNNRGERFYWNGVDWDQERRGNGYRYERRGNAFDDNYHEDYSRRRDRSRW